MFYKSTYSTHRYKQLNYFARNKWNGCQESTTFAMNISLYVVTL